MSVSAATVFGQDTKIRFFGQPELDFGKSKENNHFDGVSPTGQYIKRDTTYQSKSNFNTGNMVLFVTSQLSDRISVLSEVSFNNKGQTFNFEVQRLMLRYYIQDYFSVRVGKMFTPLGFWNNQYTLGLVLQPTIQRPSVIRPLSEGGVLQYRDVGVQVEGENITSARIFYKLMIGNGIGYYGSSDKKDTHISGTGQVGFEPLDGFKILGSGMIDRMEKGKPTPSGAVVLPDNGNLLLFTASAAYLNPEKKPEFIVEYLHQNSNFSTIKDSKSSGFYTYAGYRVADKITPYVLYNHVQAGKVGDPDLYFSPIPLKTNTMTLGIRYKFNASFVYKLEYEYQKQNFIYPEITAGTVKLDDGFTNSTISNRVRMQFAFVF